jgi:hypothetical protein
MVATVNLHPDPCDHWRFYHEWIPGKELAIWQPGNKWNATAKNRLSFAHRNGYYDYDCNWSAWNNSRDHIFRINTSAKVRQGNPMNPAYFDYPSEKNITNTCQHHGYYLAMVIKNGQVVAYAVIHICGDFANISTIIGHHDYLKDGIMLPLMNRIQLIAMEHEVKAMSYGEWMSGHNEDGKNGLQYFKHSVGFEPVYLECK